MLLVFGGKLEYPEKTHKKNMQTPQKSSKSKPGFEFRTSLLWGIGHITDAQVKYWNSKDVNSFLRTMKEKGVPAHFK